MRLITNQELRVVSGGLGCGARSMAEGEGRSTVSSGWWSTFTSWLGGIFSVFSGGSSEMQTVEINGGTRFSDMTSSEQDALEMAIEREALQAANPGCTVTISRTNHGATYSTTITGSKSPSVGGGYSQQTSSTTKSFTCTQ